MAAKVQLNNFRFSIYIDADGTVTLTDLPPELREVAEALDPAPRVGNPVSHLTPQEATPAAGDSAARQPMSGGLGEGAWTIHAAARRETRYA